MQITESDRNRYYDCLKEVCTLKASDMFVVKMVQGRQMLTEETPHSFREIVGKTDGKSVYVLLGIGRFDAVNPLDVLERRGEGRFKAEDLIPELLVREISYPIVKFCQLWLSLPQWKEINPWPAKGFPEDPFSDQVPDFFKQAERDHILGLG